MTRALEGWTLRAVHGQVRRLNLPRFLAVSNDQVIHQNTAIAMNQDVTLYYRLAFTCVHPEHPVVSRLVWRVAEENELFDLGVACADALGRAIGTVIGGVEGRRLSGVQVPYVLTFEGLVYPRLRRRPEPTCLVDPTTNEAPEGIAFAEWQATFPRSEAGSRHGFFEQPCRLSHVHSQRWISLYNDVCFDHEDCLDDLALARACASATRKTA